jgi:signal transduction histidine kinase
MIPADLFGRYQELQAYVGWGEADRQRVQAAAAVLGPHLPPLVDDFYAEVARHPDTQRVIEGAGAAVERLKATLGDWLQELLRGPYDRHYVQRRWQVGHRHVEVGLDQTYVSAAMARLRAGLVQALGRYWPGDPEALVAAILSLGKLLDLDLAVIADAYQTEYLARACRNDALATVGHVAGGVGHELRDPLNVVKTSVYYLRHASARDPLKVTEHWQRIERHLGAAEQVLTELSDFVRMPVPNPCPFAVGSCVDEALQPAGLDANIRLEKDFPDGLPPVLADKEQIGIAFAHLIRRARDGMPRGGRLTVRGRPTAGHVEVEWTDTGSPLSGESLRQLKGPLSWASVRALGMELAMAKAILEWNKGSLRATSEAGEGCTLTVRLARAPSDGPPGSVPRPTLLEAVPA